ncbi:four-carbon acid sugar kinase family protein [Polluticaenibacter yanchengensis]|uniref:Four-carbon acid sugar kinase family protein n=1 Tax=Polluticaenibacter yanchengensis TaxID=3014562 RepID=A0ABT4UPM7_9BACT|nr:four-carbon acid sugar kinase family protein [Chitinophagaceae bacterium LY-5]
MAQSKLRFAYYGDDFTGSTDALEFLSNAGVKTRLFIDAPAPPQLERFPELEAIGVAGNSRSLPPAEMTGVLNKAFSQLSQLHLKQVHYKICSTFDSSPAIGNIGTAISVGQSVFKNSDTPVLAAAPALGRYTIFGNMFARMGIGSDGRIYRLDRHPSMSKHPVTPADEADLTLHLARQTDLKIGLIDINQITEPAENIAGHYKALVKQGTQIIFIDAMYVNQLKNIGKALELISQDTGTLFTVGSSGVEMAMTEHWNANKSDTDHEVDWPVLSTERPILVGSGSCSPVTSKQIELALNAGFKSIALDVVQLLQNNTVYIIEIVQQAIDGINSGQSVLLHTSLGTNDSRNDASVKTALALGIPEARVKEHIGYHFGTTLGTIARLVAGKTNVLKRIVIAGGDTSSYAARAMGIESVVMIAPLSIGAPLCRASAPESPVDGMEVNFKGGQVGSPDYFIRATKHFS